MTQLIYSRDKLDLPCSRGGNLNNGANAGPFNVNVNNAFSNANVNYGCRANSRQWA